MPRYILNCIIFYLLFQNLQYPNKAVMSLMIFSF